VEPHSVGVKLDDQLIDAFGLGLGQCHRAQRFAMALNLFVYFYARLAHGLTPGCFYIYDCRAALVQF
jgi:hypothetical protein